MEKIGVFVFIMVFFISLGFAAELGVGLNAELSSGNDSIQARTYANAGSGEQVRLQIMAQDGSLNEGLREGQEFRIQVREENRTELREVNLLRSQNRIMIQSGNVSASCSEECNLNESGNQFKIMKRLSNGVNAEVKVMPDTASERALERLRLKVCSEEDNCTLELKEVSAKGESNVSLAYELKRERQARIFGFINSKMNVGAEVDAETGEVLKVNKPWWAFLASEPEEDLENNSQ